VVDQGREAGVLLDAGHGQVAMHMDAFSRAADDYRTPHGLQPNSARRTEGQAVGGSYVFTGGFVGLALTHQTSLYHIPGTASAAANTRIDLEQTKLLSKGEYRPSSAAIEAIRFWIGATDYKHNELGRGDDGADGVQATFKNREQEARIEVQSMPFDTRFGQLTSALGAQFGNQRLGTGGEAGALLAPSRTRSAAAYLFNELAVSDTLRVQAAGRIETVSVAGTAATFPSDLRGLAALEPEQVSNSRRFLPTSASLGVLQDLPFALTASLTGQYVERAPKAIELYAKGPHDASGTFEIGDAALNTEAATTIEAGLRRRVGRLRFEANVYRTRYAGFIFKRLTGIACGGGFARCGEPDANELTQIVYGQRNARFTGGELAAQFDVAPVASGMLGVDGQYDIVRARFDHGGAVPRMPPQRLGGGVWWRNDAWFARVGLLHAFAPNNLADNETPTDGYNLLKAELSYTYRQAMLPLGPQEITLGLVGDNLLDDDVRNHVAFRKDEVLQPGRGVRLFADVKF
jgi:iron complex outermembrane receptor protein